MSSFQEIAEAAAQEFEGGSNTQNTDTSSEAPDIGQAPPETQASEQQQEKPEAQSASGDLSTQEVKDILDLGKLGKFKFEGKEMTYDELRKSYLRHQDYTKKTQEIAQERKFQENLYADLQQVAKNPQLIAEFKQIYPEKFHSYLAFVQKQEQQAQQNAQSQTQQLPQSLPPEILERIERQEKMLEAINQDSSEAMSETLNNTFETLEKEVMEKYPKADMVHVLSHVQSYLDENGVNAKSLLKNREGLKNLFNDVAKSSHEMMTKKFESWQKQQLEEARKVNKKAGDIGRGGATPTGPAQKMRLKDVADHIIADLNN